MQTRIPRSLIELTKRVPPLYRAATGARRAVGIARGPRRVAGLEHRVHPNDTMIDGTDPVSVERYASSGAATVEQFVALAERHVGPADSLQWMELGCGYGRLLRHLVKRVPAGQITATDIDPRAVAFCQSELGVTGLPSDHPSDELRFPEVDVLYAVSVISHLDVDAMEAVLRLILRTVRPGGMAALSTHGPSTLQHLDHYGPSWPPKRDVIEQQLAAAGTAYLPYPGLDPGYGMAWHQPEHLTDRIQGLGGPRVRSVDVLPRGLEQHQDLYVVVLAPA